MKAWLNTHKQRARQDEMFSSSSMCIILYTIFILSVSKKKYTKNAIKKTIA